ncbi:MAG: N-acetyltransferase [Gemmataceae bacterium]|nr:N-acetyltransferase [Gemmataceae bacterium]
MNAIDFLLNEKITAAEFIDVLNRSSLGQRRPVDDLVCMQGMLDHANLLVTARSQGKLVGVSRSVTDFHFCCYLSCLAVDSAFQRHGIGKELIRLTQAQLGARCTLLLVSAPAAVDYYPHIGFEHHPQAWILKPGAKIV